jgi:hypothetical protein
MEELTLLEGGLRVKSETIAAQDDSIVESESELNVRPCS